MWFRQSSYLQCNRITKSEILKYKDPGFNCTDSFCPHTCKKIQNGAQASVEIKTIVPLYISISFSSESIWKISVLQKLFTKKALLGFVLTCWSIILLCRASVEQTLAQSYKNLARSFRLLVAVHGIINVLKQFQYNSLQHTWPNSCTKDSLVLDKTGPQAFTSENWSKMLIFTRFKPNFKIWKSVFLPTKDWNLDSGEFRIMLILSYLLRKFKRLKPSSVLSCILMKILYLNQNFTIFFSN